MKRLIIVLSGLLVLPAFAEVSPFYYDDEVAMMGVVSDDENFVAETAETVDDADMTASETETSVQNTSVTSSRSTGRVASSRALPSSVMRTNASGGNNAGSRNLPTRASGVSGATVARTTASRAGTTRAGATAGAVSRGTTASRATSSSAQKTATARSASGTSGTNAARVSIVQTDTVSKPLYTGRVSSTSAVRARVPAVRMATSSVNTSATTSVADTTASMDELAEMSDYCKAQYTQCMDNFCNVLDDNQGRCSCSANIKNYAKTETALKNATESLQDVAQQIQYIGLSKDEIETLFTQTEAELQMSKTTDNTQLKNDLDRIKNMLVDVKTGTASVSTDTGMSFDLSGLLDFSFTSSGFDLSTLLGTTSANTSSISNQRGEQLYKTAASRCKAAVLNTCANQGVDISVITNSYDLEIDKQCVAYERSLSDANDQMASTVRNAKSVLQKARLMVAQQKNAYDLRGCINALDSCMQDDYVCGADYENCLDPKGKYVVNGEIVVGGLPGVSGGELDTTSTTAKGMYDVWNYKVNSAPYNAFGNGTISEFVSNDIYKSAADFTSTPTSMVHYLQQKMGYNADGKNYGMCMSVLNKCQDLTYDKSKSGSVYNPDNEVVRTYLERVSVQIKAAQDEILANYAESCISDVSSCLSQNNYGSLTTVVTEGGVSAVAVAACRPVINSCMSVTGYGWNIPDNIFNWLQTTLQVTISGAYSDESQITTQQACLAVYGTWNASITPKCKCGTNAEFKYGQCLCSYEGGIKSDGTQTCCAQDKTWDETSKSCK